MQDNSFTDLQKEWFFLKDLINDFKCNEHILNAVIRRESADKAAAKGAAPDSGLGLHTIQAYEGYILLIRAYMAINADSLSEQQSEKLQSARRILKYLHQQDLDLCLLDAASFSAYKASKKAHILATLEAIGEGKLGLQFALLLLDYGASPDLSMLMRDVKSPELQQALRLKYLASFATSTGIHEGISKTLPAGVKKLFPDIFPPGRDEHDR